MLPEEVGVLYYFKIIIILESLYILQNIELADFKVRRNNMFKKSLTEFVEMQLKHSNVIILKSLFL